ncbi:MAG: DNA-binding protein [Planctomycetes bacterium]|nr:DNA-binding protein [Planctomycetota bacterium]MBI3845271.1 DNA-binding protein [Planctomycetota bacterium]
MPEKKTLERARKDKRQGKSPSTQAGEFVREEIHHVREGKHGARSTKQAIAIGLSKARRAGVHLPPPAEGQASVRTRRRAERDYEKGKHPSANASSTRSRASENALKHEGHQAATPEALARHARTSAARRGKTARSKAARKAARTKGARNRSLAAKKAAETRAARS